MGVLNDANTILLFVASHEQGVGDSKRGRYALDGKVIAAGTGLDADRIADAVEILKANRLVDVEDDACGTFPYTFALLELTAAGRVEAERLQHDDPRTSQTDHGLDRFEQLLHFFRELRDRIPLDGQPSQPWQDEVVAAVSECFDLRTDALTPFVAQLVPVAKKAALQSALRRLRERAGRYNATHNPEIAVALDQIGEILGNAAEGCRSVKRGGAAVESPLPPRSDQRELLTIIARLMFEEQKPFVQGLDIRARIHGGRESKRKRLQELVPEFLQLHGTPRADAYSLTPRGLLQTDLAQTALRLAVDLRRFALPILDSGRDSFTWDEVRSAVLLEGRALQQGDFEFVVFVFFCLGFWGRGGTTWNRPPAEQLEDLIEIDDVETLFHRTQAVLTEMQEQARHVEMRLVARDALHPMTINNFHAPIGAVAAAAGAVAQGTVVVHQLDAALKSVIERQDELEALTDTLLPLLRTARKLEQAGGTEAELLVLPRTLDDGRARGLSDGHHRDRALPRTA